ncbi:integrase arm-type DNA-binding domain-containing protein [Halodesulfovibrio spirochaetisodalis]|uniref:integrase arm-type DNA-binding domain-containing protein n=1 Tax=Halodesulfovibrio spirochaetisodalis TaxID=1560234 RepID=UPI000830309A|nr:integrase arm-type DNA-binding domain-containing protein [Halodesulfovibrio spirochaetisodalis]
MKLNVMKINHAKPAEKTYALPDGNGLQLEVTPGGKKLWRYRYQLNGRRNRMSFGSYPEVGLKDARNRRIAVEEVIAKGFDPVEFKQKEESREAALPAEVSEVNVEAYEPLVYQGSPVVPTQLLAQLYGCNVKNIKQNYKRNEKRFVEGKHYYKVEGEELRRVKHLASQRGQVKISTQTPTVLLWTERGAARHAKMLETDAAWDVFEKLEDAYFNRETDKDVVPALRKRFLRRYIDLDVITSLTVARELELDHSSVVANVFALDLPQEIMNQNFPIGEEVIQGRERVSVVAMTHAGFQLVMQHYSGKRVKEFMLNVAEEFALCSPVNTGAAAVETVAPRCIKPRIDAQKMLALKGALRIYAAMENRTYVHAAAELCSYFKIGKLEDLGIESYDIALEYVWMGIERPYCPAPEAEERCSDQKLLLLRGALDLWAYHADSRSYSEVMIEFERTTGVAIPESVPEKDVQKVLLIIWGKISAALALKEAAQRVA